MPHQTGQPAGDRSAVNLQARGRDLDGRRSQERAHDLGVADLPLGGPLFTGQAGAGRPAVARHRTPQRLDRAQRGVDERRGRGIARDLEAQLADATVGPSGSLRLNAASRAHLARGNVGEEAQEAVSGQASEIGLTARVGGWSRPWSDRSGGCGRSARFRVGASGSCWLSWGPQEIASGTDGVRNRRPCRSLETSSTLFATPGGAARHLAAGGRGRPHCRPGNRFQPAGVRAKGHHRSALAVARRSAFPYPGGRIVDNVACARVAFRTGE